MCSGASALVLALNASAPSFFFGTILLTGPYALWILGAQNVCWKLVALENGPGDCDVSVGPVSSLNYTTSAAGAGSLNLSRIPFDFTGELGQVPAGVSLALVVVDTGPTSEVATATSALALAPAEPASP